MIDPRDLLKLLDQVQRLPLEEQLKAVRIYATALVDDDVEPDVREETAA
jgi:hypothetical protein